MSVWSSGPQGVGCKACCSPRTEYLPFFGRWVIVIYVAVMPRGQVGRGPAGCWVKTGWQPLPQDPAAPLTGFTWPLPPAAQEHWLPDWSLLGMDKAGIIQVRQPNVHCKCSLQSGHQYRRLHLSQQIQMHSSLCHYILSLYIAKPYKPWPTIWSLPTPIPVGPT